REPFEFDVTQILKPRNELVVEVESPTPSGGLWGEVVLEVRCPAFLRRVKISSVVTRKGVDLKATGEVVGVSEGPLELFLVLEGRSLVYRSVEPTAPGQPFELFAPGLQLQLAMADSATTSRLYQVRVDLVQG